MCPLAGGYFTTEALRTCTTTSQLYSDHTLNLRGLKHTFCARNSNEDLQHIIENFLQYTKNSLALIMQTHKQHFNASTHWIWSLVGKCFTIKGLRPWMYTAKYHASNPQTTKTSRKNFHPSWCTVSFTKTTVFLMSAVRKLLPSVWSRTVSFRSKLSRKDAAWSSPSLWAFSAGVCPKLFLGQEKTIWNLPPKDRELVFNYILP